MKKYLLYLFFLIVLIFLISFDGCTWFGEKEGIVEVSDPIIIGINYFPSARIFALAEDLGYYKEEGVNAKTVLYEDYSKYMQAIGTGEVDITGVAFMDVFGAWENGQRLKVVAVADYSYGADAILVRKGLGINDIEDLKGKKIAVEVGTMGEFLLDFALTTRGGVSADDVEKINLTAKEATDAFMNDEVDIAVSYEPYVYEAISQGNAEVIFDTRNERGLIPDVLVVEESKLEERREDFEKVVKAWFRAVDYLKNNHEEATTLIGEGMGLTQEEYAAQLSSLYILDLRDNITAFSIGSGFDSLYGSGRLISDFFLSKNLIEESPDIAEMLDNSIVKDLYSTSSN